MELIDRKALINHLKEENIPFNADINEIINIQPIVFDTEKVVEQLKSLSNAEADYYYARSNDVIDRETAIDIVKKGGVE